MNEFNTLCEEVLTEDAQSLFRQVWASIKKLNPMKLVDFLKGKYEEWVEQADPKLKDKVKKVVGKNVPVSEGIGDAIKGWWKDVEKRAYPALEFYPALTVFIEIDKLIKGANFRILTFYAIFWLVIVSIKHGKEALKKVK